jgi:streptogramin lyase
VHHRRLHPRRLHAHSPYGGPNVTVAPANGAVWFDVAILDGRWFVIDGSGGLDELFPGTNQIKKALPGPAANSLGTGPDGFLYAASDQVYRIDPDTGASTLLGQLPAGYTSSGDVAFLDGQMYVSTDGPCGGSLVRFDTQGGTSTVIGGDGLGCVYGLAVANGTMFVVNCDGTVGTFDPTTGVVRVLSTTGVEVYGADVLP